MKKNLKIILSLPLFYILILKLAVTHTWKLYFKKKPYVEVKKIKEVKSEKLLSIVIPSYCRSRKKIKFLDYALQKINDNILNIDNFNYEIILFDNSSIESLEFFLKKYPKLHIIYRKSNILLEAHDSWRTAASYSCGKYIFFHSDDDFIYENFFDEFINLTKNNISPDIFYWKSKNVNDEDYDSADYLWYWNWPLSVSGYFKIKSHFIKHPMPSSSWMLKRKFYEKYGVLPSIQDGIDLDLAFRITKYLKKGYFLSKTVSAYRHHSDQGTKIDDPQLIDSYKWFINKGLISYRYFSGIKATYFSYLYILYYGFLHALKGKLVEDLHNQNNENKKIIYNFLFGRFLSRFTINLTKNYLYFFDKEIFFMLIDTYKARPKYMIEKIKKSASLLLKNKI